MFTEHNSPRLLRGLPQRPDRLGTSPAISNHQPRPTGFRLLAATIFTRPSLVPSRPADLGFVRVPYHALATCPEVNASGADALSIILA
jgi:hypothetical protein